MNGRVKIIFTDFLVVFIIKLSIKNFSNSNIFNFFNFKLLTSSSLYLDHPL